MLAGCQGIRKQALTGNLDTRDSLLVLELEAEALGIVAQILDVCELEVDPVLAVKDLRTVLGVESDLAVAAVVAVETSTQTSKANTEVDGGQIGFLGGRRRRSSALSGLGGLRGVLAEALTSSQFQRRKCRRPT